MSVFKIFDAKQLPVKSDPTGHLSLRDVAKLKCCQEIDRMFDEGVVFHGDELAISFRFNLIVEGY